MNSRRSFLLISAASVAAPFIARARNDFLSDRINNLPQLQSLQVQRGDEIVFAEAPRGPGLDRLANIKSCSKSIVALLLGIAIDRSEISSVNSTIQEVAPQLLPANATPGSESITMEDLVTLRAGLERTSGGNY
ncbi:hypothetical protein [Ruegeria arenilitoris]|uniref:hypothetical protein n=1 Tax=Ruegeria arenilitoris TaxID=1173585 RepID=UPI003463D177